MFGGYFDESTQSYHGKKIYCIAGYFGRVEDWLELESRWIARLQQYELKYFRASECENCIGEFAKFRAEPTGLSKPLTQQEKSACTAIKAGFVTIAVTSQIVGIAATALIEDFESLTREDVEAKKFLTENPYYICLQAVLTEVGHKVRDLNARPGSKGEIVAFIFDEHEECSGRAQLMYDQFQAKNPIAQEWMGSLTYSDDKKLCRLQVADNLAYEVGKLLLNSRYYPTLPERIAMTRLKENLLKIYRFDRASLEMVIRAQSTARP